MNTKTAYDAEKSFERARLPVDKTVDGSHFAALYSAEHVAGGEFVVGVAFASWGASPAQVILGLLIGNLLAVLSWALVCSPIAVRARITLYFFLERLAGVRMTYFYNILNGVIFAVISGGMITISASAVNALSSAPPQIHLYPTSVVFVGVALFLGFVVILLTLRGFDSLSKVSKLCAPWLMCIFVVSGLGSLAFLMREGEGLGFAELFSRFVWTGVTPDGSPSFSIWHIAAFAWGLNLPLHLGMGDLSTLRFARKKFYGFNSAFAAFGGHFMAWIACGILGATTAILLHTKIWNLDVGSVVLPILGVAGIAAVVIASLTTAIPSFYRSCLAFAAVFPRLAYERVVVIFGIIVAIFACSPFVFLKWLDIMAYFNIALAPIGAIIFAEHFLLPHVGIRPFWRELDPKGRNNSAILTWIFGIILAAAAIISGKIHLFFIFMIVYPFCVVVYFFMAKREAKVSKLDPEALRMEAYGADDNTKNFVKNTIVRELPNYKHPLFFCSILALLVMIFGCVGAFFSANLSEYRDTLRWILAAGSAGYFAAILAWSKFAKETDPNE